MRKGFSVAIVAVAASGASALQGASSRLEPGLAHRRDILYFEDFESYGTANSSTDPRLVLFGTKVLKVLYQAGQNSTVGKPRDIRLKGLEQAHLRFYVMFEEGYDFDQGGKVMGLIGWAPGKQAGWGGRKVHGDDGFSCRICWGRNGRIDMYTYHADMRSIYGDGFHGSARFTPGKWQCIELGMKLNTPAQPPGGKGANDGWVKLWVDGKLVKEKTGLRFRDIPELKIDRLFYSHYFGGTWKCPKDQWVYNDNIVLALDYIGPAQYRPPRRKKKEKTGPSVWELVAKKAREAREARGKKKVDAGDPLAPYAEQIRAARERALRGEAEQAARELASIEGAPDELRAIARGLTAGSKLRSWIIAGASEGRRETVWVDFFGRSTRGKLVSADEDGFVAKAMGAEVPVGWDALKPKKLHALASRYADMDGLVLDERSEALELFARAYGLDEN